MPSTAAGVRHNKSHFAVNIFSLKYHIVFNICAIQLDGPVVINTNMYES